MANTDPSRLGQINAAGSTDALLLKIFSGEVRMTYESVTKARKLFLEKVGKGKTVTFPMIGDASASYHVAGENILDTANAYLSKIKHNELVVNADEILQSSTFVADIDTLKNHFDVRSQYSSRIGTALAEKTDKAIFQKAVLAARTASTITGGNGGSILDESLCAVNASKLIDVIHKAVQKLDEKNIPSTDRYLVLSPQYYYLLVNDSTNNASRVLQNVDFRSAGSIARGDIGPEVAGLRVIKTNHMPKANILAEVGDNNTYSGDFHQTVALVAHKEALAICDWKGVTSEVVRKPELFGDLLVSSLVMGVGILRPESAIEIIDSTTFV